MNLSSTFRRMGASMLLLFILATSARAAEPALRLEQTGTKWDGWGNYLLEFRLTNVAKEPVLYLGYPSLPAFERATHYPWGWHRDKGGWCGNGLDDRRLLPGQSFTFTVWPGRGNQSWRIGVLYAYDRKNAPPAKESLVAWSPALQPQPQSWAIASAADPAGLVRTEVSRDGKGKRSWTFKLTNVSQQTLYYGGYQEADIPPVYLNQERYKWRWKGEGHVDWSGTGFGFRKLLPCQSITFSIGAQSRDRNWRIGMHLFRNAAPRALTDAYRPVWWRELPPE